MQLASGDMVRMPCLTEGEISSCSFTGIKEGQRLWSSAGPIVPDALCRHLVTDYLGPNKFTIYRNLRRSWGRGWKQGKNGAPDF